MSIVEHPSDDSLYLYPRFELQCHVDDVDEPTEVTVFTGTQTVELATQWVSIDAEHAVSLDGAR